MTELVSPGSPLALLDRARVAIEHAQSLDEVKEIRDQAEAARHYVKAAKMGKEMADRCADIRLRAERRAGELLRESNFHKGGRPTVVTENPSHDASGFKLSDLDVSHSQSSRWQKIADIPEGTFEDYLSTTKADERAEVTAKGLTKYAAQHRESEPTELLPIPDGKFRTFVADPPWQYGNISSRGAAQDHYNTMTIAEICALDVVPSRSADEAHLYLWTTAGHHRQAFDVMEAWGFEYKTYLVWCKPQMGLGNYFRKTTELVLFGIRGGLGTSDDARSIWDRFDAPRGKHSQKPTQFHDIIQRASPGPYLELFSRCYATDASPDNTQGALPEYCTCSKCRLGWSVWGNQS